VFLSQVSKVVLIAWERGMELYLAKHIAANVTLFDEEKIEFLNAKIGRWFNPRAPNSSIDDYTKVTSILKGVEEIMHALDELLLRRAPPAKESDRLRASYLSPAWTDTHEKFDARVLGKFETALSGEGQCWTARDRFDEGMDRIKVKVLLDLEVWTRKQRAFRGAGVGGAGAGGGAGAAGGLSAHSIRLQRREKHDGSFDAARRPLSRHVRPSS